MIKRILFASDFSRISRRAEEYTVSIASATGASVTILHAIEPIEGAEDEDASFRGFFDGLRKKAELNGDKVAARLRDAGVHCDIHVETGKRWQVIVEQARTHQFDMLVLGHHAIQDGNKVYIGTTTHKVFFSVDVPLLVVPAVDETEPA